MGNVLDLIQNYCVAKKLPPLTSIVVAEDNGLPSTGFKAATDIFGGQARVFIYDWFKREVPTSEELPKGRRETNRRPFRISGNRSPQHKENKMLEIKIPQGDKRSEYMQVMCDLAVLAFQTDTTRVCTYIGSTPNGVSYP